MRHDCKHSVHVIYVHVIYYDKSTIGSYYLISITEKSLLQKEGNDNKDRDNEERNKQRIEELMGQLSQ